MYPKRANLSSILKLLQAAAGARNGRYVSHRRGAAGGGPAARLKKKQPTGCFFFGDPIGTRTRVTAVKGRCLNRLTMGPCVCKPLFGGYCPFSGDPKNRSTAKFSGKKGIDVKHTAFRLGCGGRIRTCDLRVMSPTSYRTAPPRDVGRLSKDAISFYSKCNLLSTVFIESFRRFAFFCAKANENLPELLSVFIARVGKALVFGGGDVKFRIIVAQKRMIAVVTQKFGSARYRVALFQVFSGTIYFFHADVAHQAYVHCFGKYMAEVCFRNEQRFGYERSVKRSIQIVAYIMNGRLHEWRKFRARHILPRLSVTKLRHQFCYDRPLQPIQRFALECLSVGVRFLEKIEDIFVCLTDDGFCRLQRFGQNIGRKVDDIPFIIALRGNFQHMILLRRYQKDGIPRKFAGGIFYQKNARTVYDEKYLVKKMMVRLKIALFRTARYGMVDMNALRICIGYHD